MIWISSTIMNAIMNPSTKNGHPVVTTAPSRPSAVQSWGGRMAWSSEVAGGKALGLPTQRLGLIMIHIMVNI